MPASGLATSFVLRRRIGRPQAEGPFHACLLEWSDQGTDVSLVTGRDRRNSLGVLASSHALPIPDSPTEWGPSR
jgi:hypothetical protein